MKKLIYISFGLVLLTAISCRKEVIRPNNIIENQIENNNTGDKNIDDNGSENEKSNPNGFSNNSSVNPNDSIHVITDPNRDDDDIKKPKIH